MPNVDGTIVLAEAKLDGERNVHSTTEEPVPHDNDNDADVVVFAGVDKVSHNVEPNDDGTIEEINDYAESRHNEHDAPDIAYETVNNVDEDDGDDSEAAEKM